MDASLIAILVKDVVLPEVLAIVRAHHNATGTLPTDAQVLAALDVDATRYEAVGNAFLARTGGLVVPPTTGS